MNTFVVAMAALAVFFTFAALGWFLTGGWRQRALQAEKDHKINREAQDVQNRIMLDPALRERVRRHFDQP